MRAGWPDGAAKSESKGSGRTATSESISVCGSADRGAIGPPLDMLPMRLQGRIMLLCIDAGALQLLSVCKGLRALAIVVLRRLVRARGITDRSHKSGA